MNRVPFQLFATLAMSALLATGQTQIQKAEISRTPADSGGRMYEAYCAVCHGAFGKGDGPAAGALKKPMGDLTLLAQNNGGDFPANRVMTVLGQGPGSAAHGADMPVWGNVFRDSGKDRIETQMRIYNLTRFLDRMQVLTARKVKIVPAEPPLMHLTGIPVGSGEAMYHTLCAGCHGSRGQGDGPASPLLKGERLDLTHLARTHGGKYPAQQVTNVLGAQSGIVAHGNKEMPIWGESFRGAGEDRAVVRLRIANLVDYVKTLQVK